MALLEDVKLALSITSTGKDSVISNQIESAKIELSARGVQQIRENDPLTKQAVTLYVSWANNYQGDADRYWTAFERTANAMAKNGDYRDEQ